MPKADVTVRDASSVTITVTITTGFRLRAWLATRFFRFAGRLVKADIKIEFNG